MKTRIFSVFCLFALICLFSANAFASGLGMPAGDIALLLSNGESLSLTEQLKDKSAVIITIFDGSEASLQALSALDAACESMKDKIVPVVIPSGEAASVSEEAYENLVFAKENPELTETFGAVQLPHAAIIDRFGNVCFSGFAEIDAAERWQSLIDPFIADIYPASVILEDIPASMADYAIAFTDESGNPVPGVMAQVCDDKRCMVFPSGANGKVEFTETAYAYEVHVLMAPGDFAPDTQVYTLPEAGGEITIVLKAK